MSNRHQLNNTELANHTFLQDMYDDDYFPHKLVQKGENILVELCRQIETEQPENLDALYELPHADTERFNELAE